MSITYITNLLQGALKKYAVCLLVIGALLPPMLASAHHANIINAVKLLPPAAITSFLPASGAPGTLIKIKGTGLAGATLVTINNKPALLISTADTVVVAMVMPGNTTGAIRLTNSSGTVLVSASKFSVTATPYPSVQQGPKLTDTATRSSGFYRPTPIPRQGSSVAISADGNAAIVGGMDWLYPSYLFYDRVDGKWSVSAAIGSSQRNPVYDNTLALSADGNTALIGEDGYTSSLPATLYRRTNGKWAQAGTLNDSLGTVVGLSADGKTAILGKQQWAGVYSSTFAPLGITILKYDGNRWQAQPVQPAPLDSMEVLVPSREQNGVVYSRRTVYTGQPGSKVAISADGKTAASLSFHINTRYYQTTMGYAVIYALTPAGWQIQAKLPEARSLKLSADGNTCLIDSNIYVRSGQSWLLQQIIPEAVGASISADGNTIVCTGQPAVYYREGNTWARKSIPTSNIAGVGNVALSADGTTAIFGLPDDATHYAPPEYTPPPYEPEPPLPLGAVAVFAVQPPTPGVFATALRFTNTTQTSTTLSWANGNGASRAVFIKTGTLGYPAPADGVSYTANPAFGQGAAIGTTGWYCVYDGKGSSVNITGLSATTTYHVAVVEYNGIDGTQKYLSNKGGPANVTTLTAPGAPATPPTGYATAYIFSNTTATTTTLSWINSNGAKRAVFLHLGTSGALNVMQGQTYTANSIFKLGTQVGTNGWYCVYNGTASSVDITGLTASSTYRAIVLEYNGTAGTEGYNLSRYNGANVTTTAAPTLLLTTNQKRMLVEQDVLEEANIEVNVHQALSPNGDGVNDVFTIDGIGSYPENTVKVINGSGDVIYSTTGYNNYSKAFDGRAANGTLQKAGTYFYSLEYKKGKEAVRKTGYLVLKY